MKALEKSKAGVIVAEVDEIGAPSRGQVLIDVKAASLNRADYAVSATSKGRVVGSDVAGIVRAAGEGVCGFAVGDRVCAVTSRLSGGLAELAIASETWTAHLPDSMDFTEGAAIPSAGVTALAAVEKIRSARRASVFVCGASGGVGQYAVALAKAKGARVVAACSARNRDIALGAGADEVFDYSNGLGALPEKSYDAALLVNGAFKSREYIRILRPGGRLILVGSDALSPSMLSAPLHRMSLSVATFFAVIGKGGLQRAVDMVSAAGFRPAIEEREGFEGAKSALEDLGKRHPSGKTVIKLAD